MKIIGLPYSQRKALSIFMGTRDINGDYEIHFLDSISLKRLNSLWYGGGVVNITYNGYTFHIEAVGDINANLYSARDSHRFLYVKDKNNNGNLGSEMLQYIKTDRTLSDALSAKHNQYRLELDDGNWWECFITDPRGVFHDLMLNLDADYLFEAIADVLGNLDEIITHTEE